MRTMTIESTMHKPPSERVNTNEFGVRVIDMGNNPIWEYLHPSLAPEDAVLSRSFEYYQALKAITDVVTQVLSRAEFATGLPSTWEFPVDTSLTPHTNENQLRIRERLASFKKLEDGWADGMQHPKNWGDGLGEAPSLEGLDWLAGQMEDCYRNDLPHPYLYPTTDGGVKIEWSIGPFEAGLRVDLSMKTGKWFCVNMDIDWVLERHLDLNDAIDWQWLASELRWLGKTTA